MNTKSFGIDASFFIGAVASVSVVFAVSALTVMILSILDGLSLIFIIEKSLALAAVSSICAAVVLLFWGMPFHILFAYFHITSLGAYLLIGLFGGPIFLLFIRPFGIDPPFQTLIQAGILGAFGVIASASFWLFSVKKIMSGSQQI